MSFAAQLEAFRRATLENAGDIKAGAAIAFSTAVIEDTPVDTGRAKGNWQLTIGDPAEGVVDDTAQEALRKVSFRSNYGSIFDVNYLTNNLPYIERLEFGYSEEKAPDGMVRKNVIRFDRLVQAAIRR